VQDVLSDGREALSRPDGLPRPARRLGRPAAAAEAAADLCPDLVLLVDDQERVVYANRRLPELLGFPFLSFFSLDHLLGEAGLADVRRLVRETEEGEASAPAEVMWRRQGGPGVCLEVRIRREGNQTAIVARDTDEVRRRHHSLSDQAEVARRIAHDLKNIQTYLVAGEDFLRMGDPRSLQNVGQVITHACSELDAYTRRLSEFGGRIRTFAPLDPRALLEQAADRAQRDAPSRHVVLRLDPVPPVSGDRQRLAEGLTALLSAALAATPTGQSLRVALEAHHRRVEISVRIPTLLVRDDFEAHLSTVNFALQSGPGYNLPLAAHTFARHGGALSLLPRADSPPNTTELRAYLPSN
jgi:signal transduction histidine kinase